MANTYTAITKKDGGWWIGWIEEVPGVNCQERTREELIASLKATLKEAIELNRGRPSRQRQRTTAKSPLVYEAGRSAQTSSGE